MTEEEQNKIATNYLKLKAFEYIRDNTEQFNKDIQALIDKATENKSAGESNDSSESVRNSEDATNAAKSDSATGPA